MVALQDWIGETSLRLNGCPDPVILEALRRNAQQFCRDTRLWVQTMGTATISPSDDFNENIKVAVPAADFVVPDGALLHDIEKVLIDGEPIADLVDDNPYSYDKITLNLSINPRAVNQESELEVFASFQPNDLAMAIPDGLIEWKPAIVDRALYELLLMPNKDWTDGPTANVHLKDYKIRIGEGTVAKAKQNSRLPVRTSRIPFL